jgi:hypothetical protein
MRIVVEVGDLMQRTTDGQHTGRILGGRTIGRSDNTVCDLHRAQEDKEHEFLGLTLKLRSIVSPDLGLKIDNYDLMISVSESLQQILGLGLKIK